MRLEKIQRLKLVQLGDLCTEWLMGISDIFLVKKILSGKILTYLGVHHDTDTEFLGSLFPKSRKRNLLFPLL